MNCYDVSSENEFFTRFSTNNSTGFVRFCNNFTPSFTWFAEVFGSFIAAVQTKTESIERQLWSTLTCTYITIEWFRPSTFVFQSLLRKYHGDEQWGEGFLTFQNIVKHIQNLTSLNSKILNRRPKFDLIRLISELKLFVIDYWKYSDHW